MLKDTGITGRNMMKQLNDMGVFPAALRHLVLTFIFLGISVSVLIYPIRDTGFVPEVQNGHISFEDADPMPSTNEGFYYSMMNDDMKDIYTTLYNGIYSHRESIMIPPSSPEKVKRIFYAVIFDNPELIHLSDYYSYKTDRDGNINVFIPYYTISMEAASERIKAINAEVNVIKESTKDMADYGKELYIHEYLLKKCSYVTGDNVDGTLYGAIVTGKTNCRGYSAAFSYLLNSCGVKAGQMIGEIESSGKKEGHSWNFVILDGEFYYCDICWDDIKEDDSNGMVPFHYSFFNMTYDELVRTHDLSNQSIYLFPINGTNNGTYSYMKQNGLYAENCEEAYDIIVEKLGFAKASSRPLFIQFRDNRDYEEISSSLDKVLKSAKTDAGIEVSHCRYMKIQKGNTIIIFGLK